MLKSLYKVWSGFTKFIKSQVMQDRCVDVSFLGKFFKNKDRFTFIPSIEFIDAGGFIFREDDANISPFISNKVLMSFLIRRVRLICLSFHLAVLLLLKSAICTNLMYLS